MAETFDYVVVGGGSSGCIAAAELADLPDTRVLLLECGPAAEENPETLDADGYKYAFMNDAVIWERFSEPQRHSAKKRKFMGTGTGMGGSGSVNGMVYTRGAALDYEEWPSGWKWRDVVPDFEAVERALRPNRRPPTRFTEAVLTSAEKVGFRRSEDLNDGDLSGVMGYEWMNYEGDRRRNSYVAFIKDRGRREDLVIRTRARVHRLELDERRRVTGVLYEIGGALERAAVRREVVMCAGALETPKLLMLSGIGPVDTLRRFQVPIVFEAPNVGKNLHDHPNVPMFFLGKEATDCNYPQLYGFHRAHPGSDWAEGQSDTCYVGYPARSSLIQATHRMVPGLVLPQPLYTDTTRRAVRLGMSAVFAPGFVRGFVERVWGIVVILGKPRSRGALRLASADPRDQASLDPMWFSVEQDMKTMVEGVKLARRIAGADPCVSWGNGALSPFGWVQSDAAIAKFIEANAMTTYHFAGTCRMGDDEASVTDARLRFRGIENLRIGDASVIPTTPVSALNAPSMMIGYRAARFIREERQPVSETRKIA